MKEIIPHALLHSTCGDHDLVIKEKGTVHQKIVQFFQDESK